MELFSSSSQQLPPSPVPLTITIPPPQDKEEDKAEEVDLRKEHQAHGILMGIAWGFLLPLGAFIVAFGKPRKRSKEDTRDEEQAPLSSLWFALHVCKFNFTSY